VTDGRQSQTYKLVFLRKHAKKEGFPHVLQTYFISNDGGLQVACLRVNLEHFHVDQVLNFWARERLTGHEFCFCSFFLYILISEALAVILISFLNF
jgi:hypothetical protein